MKAGDFLIRLLFLSALWIGFLWALGLIWPAANAHFSMSLASSLLFVVLCAVLYAGGLIALRRPDPNAFTGLVLASVFLKMIAALLFLFAYKHLVQPEGKWYVGIFLMSYVVYTAYEVWFLYRMSEQK